MELQPIPKILSIPEKSKIKDIVCGINHTILINENSFFF